MSLNDRIREARKKKGITQEQLGELIGVAKTTIAGYEKNREPTAAKVGEIADALEVDVNFLFQDEVRQFYQNHATSEELSGIKKYRVLDKHGKKLVASVLDMEYERVNLQVATPSAKKTDKGGTAPKADTPRLNRKYPANVVLLGDYSDAPEDTTTIPVYDAGASAGTGIFLDSDDYDVIAIPDNYTNRKANFAVWVDGHSMEPRFSDGDLVLVRTQPTIDVDEIGIFIVNGEGFIKKLGEGELISLNPEYKNIPLNEWDEIYCKGKVLGKL